MGVNGLNSVQKGNIFKKKLKLGINEMLSNWEDSYIPVIIGFVQYQPLISAASPENMDRYTKLRTTSGQ